MSITESTHYLSLYKRHETKARFVAVGAWNTLFGYLMFVLFDTLFTGVFQTRYLTYMSANIVSNIISVINAYVFHKYITFRSTKEGTSLIIEFIRFCLTYVGTFLLSLVLLPVFVEFFRLTPKFAAALVILACVIISYVGHSKFSFKNR